MIWYACAEHIEYLLDDVVEQEGKAPDMEMLTEENPLIQCYWRPCLNHPLYQLQIEDEEEN